MSPGGEPERDDTGLPPVDIEIPDDARDLDRDVQAYHREQRAHRRRQRRLRLHRTFARDGIALPLLACCLILALITGTLLTIFTATSDQGLSGGPSAAKSTSPPKASGAASGNTGTASAPASPTASASPSPTPTARPDTVRTTLPRNATLTVSGKPPIAMSALSRAVLVLVPAHCDCVVSAGWLAFIASRAHAQTYLVYTSATKAATERLYEQLGGTAHAQAYLAADPQGALLASVPASLPRDKLTAILVGLDHHATAAVRLSGADDPTTIIQALTH